MLGPNGNLQGGFKFLALNTGKKIFWSSWDVISCPDTVITHVNSLDSNQPEQLMFTDSSGCPIGDVKIPGVDTSDVKHVGIPGVDPPEVDNIDIPGVDVEIQEPQVIGIVDPKITPTNKAPI